MNDSSSQPGEADSAPRQSVLQSPWYWLYAFAAAGLCLLMLSSDKIRVRQIDMDRQTRFSGQSPGGAETIRPAEPERGSGGLAPLYVVFSLLLIISATRVWWQQFHRRRDHRRRDQGRRDQGRDPESGASPI